MKCQPVEAGAGKLTIPEVSSGITVDGDLADWPTCFVTVTPQNAGLVRDLDGSMMFAPGRFSIATHKGRVYVGAEVTKILPLGDEPVPAVYQNNAIAVYIDGDGDLATGSDEAQIVVDHANRRQGFQPGAIIDLPDLESAAAVGDTTFTIEMSVGADTFGLTQLASSIGFDIGLVGGNGTEMYSELVWFQACAPPECGCSGGDAAPYCDPRELGVASFDP